MKRIILAVALFCFVFSSLSHAQYINRYKGYFGAEVGGFVPTESKINGIKQNSGAEFGLKYTYYFNENVGIIARLSGVAWETEKFKDISGKEHYFELTTTSLAIGLALRFPVSYALDFIAHGGVSANTNAYDYKVDSRSVADDSGSAGGYFVDLGLRYYVSERLTVGGLLRYTANNQEVDYGTKKETINWGGTSVLLEVGLVF